MNLRKLFHGEKNRYTVTQTLKWLWLTSRGNRLQATLNASIGLVGVGVSLAQVWAVQHAIDVAAGNAMGNIYLAVATMGALILIDFALNISGVWVRNILGIRAQNRLQQRLIDHILRSEWQGKEAFHSGDVLNRLEIDVNTVIVFITETLPNTLSVVTLFLGAFIYLFSMDSTLALITVAITPLFVILSKVYVRSMRRLSRQVRSSDSEVQSVMQETIQHRMLIKTLEGDDTMVERLEDTQSRLRRNVVKRTAFRVVSHLILNLGFAIGYLVAFLWAAVRMSNHTLTFGQMTAFLQLVNRIQSPARNLTKLVPAFVSVFTAAERLMELEENPLEEQGEPVPMRTPCGVRINAATFSYGEEEGDVIRNLTFDFKPGSSTAVIGETGAGKTTLLRMLLALVKPQEGTVTIYDGEDERELSPLTRCNFVYVPQGNTLMSGTVRDNLRLGRLDATEQEMRDALTKSCAEFVFSLPDGLDTVCGERGAGLSEGQAQRIAIARALLRDRCIMLFDEATAALDPDTERQLLQNIMVDNSHTVIFITHRMAVADFCDYTLRIDKIKD